MKKVVTSTLIIALLSGCAVVQNDDGTVKKTASYGAGAAFLGAAAGALIGDSKGALIGAAVVGTAAAAYGHYVDNQEAELRKSMAGTGVNVEREGDQLKLVMPGAITFATGKADITPSFYLTLNQLSGNFKQFQNNELVVTGYTDSVGSAQTNQALSSRRADSVSQYLRSNGVDVSRIKTVGAGSSNFVASNETPEGRAQNRRVEIKLVPRQAPKPAA
jgi:outer membrane protein OmpA-like peptidoglycan-associated protein